MGGTLLFLHRHPRPVSHILVGAGEGVEQRGLSAVGVARQSHPHGAAVVGRGIVAAAVSLQLVLVVPQLPAGRLRVRRMASGGRLDPARLPHDNLFRVGPAQGQLVPPQGDLQRVPQGGHLGHLYQGAGGQPHVHQPALHRPRLVPHRQDGAALSRPQIIQGMSGPCVLFHSSSLPDRSDILSLL